ncbi:transmembrane channel-like protein 6, partial [Cricetulus griseus]
VRLRRRRNSRPLLGNVVRSARPSLRLYDLELDHTVMEEDEKRSLLVKELQGLSMAQRDHMIRNMPLSLGEKRWLRLCMICPGVPALGTDLQLFLQALHSLGLVLLSGLYAARPWRYALKQIGGQFGSSVLSYFLFLKTLLAFNALMLLPLLAFLVGVQAAFPPDPSGLVPTFSGLELLTGRGCFTHTVMYYGYYSNTTLSQSCASPRETGQDSLPYNMPLAYLFTVGAAFFITCITLVYRSLILKMAVLGVLCYHWLGRRVAKLQAPCWEDFVGQELYRFLVVDFIFTLLDSLFGELVWRLISEKKLKRQKPEFDIARNVLDLIYGQTLTWLGVLFSPLLPAVQMLRLLLLFYVKKEGEDKVFLINKLHSVYEAGERRRRPGRTQEEPCNPSHHDPARRDLDLRSPQDTAVE